MWPDFVQKDQIIFCFCLPRDDDLWYVDAAVDDDVLLLVCDGSCSFPFGKSAWPLVSSYSFLSTSLRLSQTVLKLWYPTGNVEIIV